MDCAEFRFFLIGFEFLLLYIGCLKKRKQGFLIPVLLIMWTPLLENKKLSDKRIA